MKDLSNIHHPVTNLFEPAANAREWDRHRLSEEQIEFYQREGYLAGIRILTESQVDQLRDELDGLINSDETPRELFYEYNSNESTDPNKVLFHALGAWRIAPAFHDLLWNPAFLMPAAQLLSGPVRF